MVRLEIVNAVGEVLAKAEGDMEAYLHYNREYQEGDRIRFVKDE